MRKYPLRESEEYFYVASPNRCKDDAVAMQLGLTPGSKNIIVKKLTKDPLASVPNKRTLGVLIRWSKKNKKGDGARMSLDWEGIKLMSGAKITMKPGKKVLVANELLNYLSASPYFIDIEEEFAVGPALKEELSLAGYHPYNVLETL